MALSILCLCMIGINAKKADELNGNTYWQLLSDFEYSFVYFYSPVNVLLSIIKQHMIIYILHSIWCIMRVSMGNSINWSHILVIHILRSILDLAKVCSLDYIPYLLAIIHQYFLSVTQFNVCLNTDYAQICNWMDFRFSFCILIETYYATKKRVDFNR